ncbi:MAG: succinylglutamate desuccinylase/aspartoacylase family protein [Gammaproteobacteria bacterium]|nr:succinylglutamate desuccinylase/aspartoacylase family protein [Gammaproteobacteria bacterium]
MKSAVRVRYNFIKILTGSDLSIRRLPLMSAHSGNPGPVVWLTACVHGDEVVGMVVIHEIFKRVRRQLLRGAIHAFPVTNPIGLETMSRKITMSSEDLNRSFPGKPEGTLGERLASQVFNSIIASSPDLVLDLHSDWKQSIPYTVLDKRSAATDREIYARTKAFARATGLVCILESEDLHNSLTHNLLLRNTPALTLELGEPYVINEVNVQFGVDVVWNLLALLEMAEPQREPFRYPVAKPFANRLLRYSDRPYSSKSGIIRFLARPGDVIARGTPIARIFNAFGKHQETVDALADGIVLGHSDSSVVFPGMPIMAFGIN